MIVQAETLVNLLIRRLTLLDREVMNYPVFYMAESETLVGTGQICLFHHVNI